MLYHSTNDKSKKVTFKQAFLEGQSSPDFGLFMISRKDIPKLSLEKILTMKDKSYAEIAFEVLSPYLVPEIPEDDLREILNDAYPSSVIPSVSEESRGRSPASGGINSATTREIRGSLTLPRDSSVVSLLQNDKGGQDISPQIQHVADKTYIMWLTQGPTYSFKDYAARFFGRVLNYFLEKDNKRKVVITATSGDTGGAVTDALCGLECVENIVFYPRDFISERQRRQMTTLGKNIYAIAVNSDFDVCQALAKRLLGDKSFAQELLGDEAIFTSANSISVGRLLPQAIYPFYAYSRLRQGFGGQARISACGKTSDVLRTSDVEQFIASIPSGNFGDMMGTLIAKEMGLPIEKIICGVNENTEFPEFLETGKYEVKPTKKSPSSAMMVSHPSNLARLIDFYGGHMYDERDSKTKQVIKPGVIDKMPNLDEMRKDIFSVGVTNEEHYEAMKEVYEKYKIILDPHGAVGWKALDKFLCDFHLRGGNKLHLGGGNDSAGGSVWFSVIYETADPAKFPEDVEKAIGIEPEVPEGIKKQAGLEERIYYVNSESDIVLGSKKLNEKQYKETKEILKNIL